MCQSWAYFHRSFLWELLISGELVTANIISQAPRSPGFSPGSIYGKHSWRTDRWEEGRSRDSSPSPFCTSAVFPAVAEFLLWLQLLPGDSNLRAALAPKAPIPLPLVVLSSSCCCSSLGCLAILSCCLSSSVTTKRLYNQSLALNSYF